MKKEVYVVHDVHSVHDVRLHLRSYACKHAKAVPLKGSEPTSQPARQGYQELTSSLSAGDHPSDWMCNGW